MIIALIYLLATADLELLLLMNSRLTKRSFTDSIAVLLAISAVVLLYERFNLLTVLVAILMLYRIVNLARLTHRQLQDDYVNHLARRTSLWLIGLQVVALLLMAAQQHYQIHDRDWLLGLVVFDLLVAGLLAHTIDRQGRVTLPPRVIGARAIQDLPSLTVCIPARNETADLEACLKTLVHSTYEKLEILVLDDCSQNTRTPEIIRQFAHDGVRFIAGSAPPDTWLAKNHAYQQLIGEANGELILFCGVDARFEPDALRLLVETMLDKQKTMLSIMPRNLVPHRLRLEAMMVQPGRYAWELALPRRWLDRPPVLSSCWLIRASVLQEAGGLAAVHRTVLPERYFARYAATHNDGYSFLQSGETLGVTSAKQFNAQRETAIRTRYPSLHRRIELTAMVSLLEIVILVVPYISLMYGIVTRLPILAIVSGGAALLLSFMYFQVVRITYQQPLTRGVWLLPFAGLYDIGLLNYSMWMYEFRQVIWKGRNVCIPVMRVIPHLPPLDAAEQPAYIRSEHYTPHHHGHHKRHHKHRRHHH